MDPRRDDLRTRIAQARAERPEKRRYGQELKRELTAYALDRQGAGATLTQIASELEISPSLLGKWVRHAKWRRAHGLQPFERITPRRVIPARPAEGAEHGMPQPGAHDTGGRDEIEQAELILVIACSDIRVDAVTRARLRKLLSR